MGDRDPPEASAGGGGGDQGNKGSNMEYREVLKSSTTMVDQANAENGNHQSSPIANGLKSGLWVNAVQGKKVLKKYDLEI